MQPLDGTDARLLQALTEDPRSTVVALAERLGLSRNTVQARNRQSRSPSHQVLGGSHPGGGEGFDGEVVVLSDNGTTSFADLQAAFQDGVQKPLTYFAFDLLHLNGQNLRKLLTSSPSAGSCQMV